MIVLDSCPIEAAGRALTCYRLAIDLFKRKLTEGDLPTVVAGGVETKH